MIRRNDNIQNNFQENQETYEETQPLKGYKNYNKNFQTQQECFNQQEVNQPLKGYKQQYYKNNNAYLNQREEELPLRGYKAQYKNSQACHNQKEEDLPLRGYKQQNKKPQSDNAYYNQQDQFPIHQANSDLLQNQYYQYQQQNYDNLDQGSQPESDQYFRQSSNQQNREQYHDRDNQSRGQQNRQHNQVYQQYNKNNFRQQMPQHNNICYQFQTQFLRANDYYDMNELRAKFKALRQLNKNHLPSPYSHFVLIRPKQGFQNIHKAIKYGIWCSTTNVNQELSQLYYQKDRSVYLIFFPLGSRSKLIGIAQMISDYDSNQSYKYWDNDGIYKGSFELIWHSIKYVDPECIQELPYNFGRGDITYLSIDQLRDGTEIGYDDALQIFEIFNQAPEEPSVFEHFNVLDMQEQKDQKRNIKLKNQEKEEFQLKQNGLKKKYQY